MEGQALSSVTKTATALAISMVAMPANCLQKDEPLCPFLTPDYLAVDFGVRSVAYQSPGPKYATHVFSCYLGCCHHKATCDPGAADAAFAADLDLAFIARRTQKGLQKSTLVAENYIRKHNCLVKSHPLQRISCSSRAIPPLQPAWQKLLASLCGSYRYRLSGAALCVPRMRLRAGRGSTRSRCARISPRCLLPKDILSTSNTDVKGDNVRLFASLLLQGDHPSRKPLLLKKGLLRRKEDGAQPKPLDLNPKSRFRSEFRAPISFPKKQSQASELLLGLHLNFAAQVQRCLILRSHMWGKRWWPWGLGVPPALQSSQPMGSLVFTTLWCRERQGSSSGWASTQAFCRWEIKVSQNFLQALTHHSVGSRSFNLLSPHPKP
ncbi:hypothetical protein DV515_00005713 [Chloebia gouldiae]|uniref:Uncharacterized protein n=1 Tax=Chloebia gouldiae TaxID=44316 RepID=A0A3L8SNH1_CHLGU|nr:hypothetical protein DV515_00005713 [Chloebia gouldiae]